MELITHIKFSPKFLRIEIFYRIFGCSILLFQSATREKKSCGNPILQNSFTNTFVPNHRRTLVGSNKDGEQGNVRVTSSWQVVGAGRAPPIEHSNVCQMMEDGPSCIRWWWILYTCIVVTSKKNSYFKKSSSYIQKWPKVPTAEWSAGAGGTPRPRFEFHVGRISNSRGKKFLSLCSP